MVSSKPSSPKTKLGEEKMNKKVRFITHAAIIAAIYAVLTMATWTFASGAIQVRLSEALCVLIYFTPAAVPGIFVGCLIANFMGGAWVDIVFGSLATLIAALITMVIPKKFKYLYPLPTVLVNTIVIPFVLYFGYGVTSMGNQAGMVTVLCILALTIFIGEAISCYVVGIPLMNVFKNIWPKISGDEQ